MNIEAEQGYLILASNTEDTDYVQCARVLAKSIKVFHPDANVAILTNDEVNDEIFDYVVRFPYDTKGGWLDDWQVFAASPFRETIKLEADMIITTPIDHWWTMFRHRDVVLSTGAMDFYSTASPDRYYRKIFDLNHLPDVYNAITYWRVSHQAQDFFNLVQNIFNNWEVFKTTLNGGAKEEASTDVVYAMAASLMGVENVTLPSSYPKIVHMKPKILGTTAEDWRKELVWELSDKDFRINTVTQIYPVHYHIKEFAKELEPLYDDILGST